MQVDPSLIDRDRLRGIMYDLAFRPGHHFMQCDSPQGAVRLRNRMNKIRAVDRAAKIKEVGDSLTADPQIVLDRMVILIPNGGATVEVAVSEEVDLSFITTRQPDGSMAPTFPMSDPAPEAPRATTLEDEGNLL